MLAYSVVNKTMVIHSRMGVLYSRFDGSNWLDTRKFEEDSIGLASYIRFLDQIFNCPIFVYLPFHKLMLRFCVEDWEKVQYIISH